MAFISKTDILAYIDATELDHLIDSVDANLDRPIADALGRIRGKLQGRYNVDIIFADPSNEAYSNIRKIAVEICIYFLYDKVAVRHIPENVMTAFQRAEADLYAIATGEWDSMLPKRTIASEDTPSGQGYAAYDEFIPTGLF